MLGAFWAAKGYPKDLKLVHTFSKNLAKCHAPKTATIVGFVIVLIYVDF